MLKRLFVFLYLLFSEVVGREWLQVNSFYINLIINNYRFIDDNCVRACVRFCVCVSACVCVCVCVSARVRV